jgi:hypothetical protein
MTNGLCASILSLMVASAAFGQAKSAESVAARLQKIEDRQAIEQLLMAITRVRSIRIIGRLMPLFSRKTVR